ncbi:hypothetical protein PENTCL1PPCAC_4559, partial [Pristionchus entomophagus]
FSLPTWFETLPSTSKDSEDTIVIWEGIAAVQSSPSPLHLFKCIDGDIYQLEMTVGNVKVLSNGYWSCAEIRGHFENGETLTYHAETPEKADDMITAITNLLGTSLTQMIVRLDPDPLRLLEPHSIATRLDEWTEVCRSLAGKWTIVFDSNMPL